LIWRIDRRSLPDAKIRGKPHIRSDEDRIGQNGTPHARCGKPLVSPLDNYGLMGGGRHWHSVGMTRQNQMRFTLGCSVTGQNDDVDLPLVPMVGQV
jgi:hypothetical protein